MLHYQRPPGIIWLAIQERYYFLKLHTTAEVAVRSFLLPHERESCRANVAFRRA
jgi:hypothetical protein